MIDEELWFRFDREAARKPESPAAIKAIADERNSTLERVIGPTVDFLPFRFLEQGVRRGQSVARIKVRTRGPDGLEILGHGTGFLIAPDLMMTNHHVLPDEQTSAESLAEFKFELDLLGNEETPDQWKFDPSRIFVTSPFEELDFTIVGVAPKDSGEAAGAVYGVIPLRLSRANVNIDENINLIQHPEGRRKEVVLHESKITGFFQGGYVHYSSDTLEGSSGSPVFNVQWDLVALHHRGVIKRDSEGHPIRENGDYVFVANEAVRISSILEHLRSDAVPKEKRTALEPHLFP